MFRLNVVHFEDTQDFDVEFMWSKSKSTISGRSMLVQLLLCTNSNSDKFTWHSVDFVDYLEKILMFCSSDLVSTGELADPWVCVDLERYYSVSSIRIFNRESRKL